jgi:sugar phosphate isomerase/epimerase
MTAPARTAVSRRHFLGAAAAAAAGMAGLPSLLRAEDKKADPFGGFTLAVQTYSFRKFPLEQALKQTQELGARHAEFYRGHVPVTDKFDQIAAVRKLCKEYDVTPIAFGVERFSKDHDANKKIFDFAKALGVKHLSADPDPDSFDGLDKLVEEYQISIAIHPHGPAGKDKLHRWYSAEVILKAVKDHHKLIGTCLDTGHLIRAAQLGEKLDPAQQVRAMGARNFGMHLKDHDNEAKRDVIYGKGALDVPAVLKALRDVKFTGYIAIEYEANENNPLPDMKACVEVFKESVKKLT